MTNISGKIHEVNNSRREFVKQSSLSALGILLYPSNLFSQSVEKHSLKEIGLIMGVIENELKQDWEKTIRAVAEIGYKYLEFNGFYGRDLNTFKKVLKETGLRPLAGGDVMVNMLNENKLKNLIEDALSLDRKYLVCYWPWLDNGNNKTTDDFKKAADNLNWIGEVCNKEGIKLAFHNHDKEFIKVDGNIFGYEYILNNTSPEKVAMELDLYWCIKGGGEPIELLKKYKGRFEIFHVKDMDNTAQKLYTCPGKGIIDFKAIFSQAKQSGVKYYNVEIDKTDNPIACITDSYKYLKELRF